MPPLIEVDRISKVYGSGLRALDEVSFSVEPGEILGILGPSGAGKSTLLRCINGFEVPTLGEVRVSGSVVSPKKNREIRKHVAMVFQSFNLIPSLNALTNVAVGRLAYTPFFWSLLYLFPPKELEIAMSALRRVGLEEYAYTQVRTLSGGQQQRIASARSLAQRPRAILADEPVASLDPATGVEILGLLREAAQEQGAAVVANLHQVSLAKQFCDRLIGLKKGRVVFDSKSHDLEESVIEAMYGKELVSKPIEVAIL